VRGVIAIYLTENDLSWVTGKPASAKTSMSERFELIHALIKEREPKVWQVWRWPEISLYKKLERDALLFCTIKAFACGEIDEVVLIASLQYQLKNFSYPKDEKQSLQLLKNNIQNMYACRVDNLSTEQRKLHYETWSIKTLSSYDRLMQKELKPNQKGVSSAQVVKQDSKIFSHPVLNEFKKRMESAKTTKEKIAIEIEARGWHCMHYRPR
jgi:hypothetical protein